MSVHHLPLTDPGRAAATARSILSCPDEVHLVVDGVEDVHAGTDHLGMQDVAGVPTFSCVPDTDLARAAAQGASALLTLESGLGDVGSGDRLASLTLAGVLRTAAREDCDCCRESRDVVELDLRFVLLAPAGDRSPDRQVRVPLEHFRSAEHHLNRGYLQRSTEHANLCHQEELRRAVAGTTGIRLSHVVGVALGRLRPHGVEVRWIDPDGAHTRQLHFPRPATSTEELGELLRSELHAGLC